MRHALAPWTPLATAMLLVVMARGASAVDPESTVRNANQVLHEAMSTSMSEIPTALLRDAQGLVIVPDVIKIGFIAGIRRGQGVVMVRQPNGAWSLPQFVTLTGGSVGWQAGVQGTDVVLVFMTAKSVEGLMRGKFTIGADAAAAAGPVGRNAAAATDARLKAEILSYSRSRGLFAGIALDGSVIETNGIAQTTYYGAGPGQPPLQVPESAAQLVAYVSVLTGPANMPAEGQEVVVPQQGGPELIGPALSAPQPAGTPRLAVPAGSTVRETLAENAAGLQSIVDQGWREYLALPKEVFEGPDPPRVDALQQSLRQYDRVAQDPKYRALAGRREFQSTHRLLQEYVRQLSSSSNRQLELPPPPRR